MANVAISNMTTAWSNISTTFTGIKLNVTDTASASGSLLMDLQVGGSSKVNVSKGGEVRLSAGSKTNVSLTAIGSSSGIFFRSATLFEASNGTNVYVSAQAPAFTLASSTAFSWSTSFPDIAGGDLILLRDAANTLAQRNGVNAQTFRLYNTFTDASNYERTEFLWNSNIAGIALTNAGTGSARSTFRIVGGSSIDLQISAPTDNNTALNFRHSSTLSAAGTSVSYVGRISGNRGFFDGGGAATLVIPSGATDRWAFFGTTSSFPALKRDTVRLQARLADDSAFTNIQGKLTTEANAVAEVAVATHTLTIYDAAGTGYKVLAVAA